MSIETAAVQRKTNALNEDKRQNEVLYNMRMLTDDDYKHNSRAIYKSIQDLETQLCQLQQEEAMALREWLDYRNSIENTLEALTGPQSTHQKFYAEAIAKETADATKTAIKLTHARYAAELSEQAIIASADDLAYLRRAFIASQTTEKIDKTMNLSAFRKNIIRQGGDEFSKRRYKTINGEKIAIVEISLSGVDAGEGHQDYSNYHSIEQSNDFVDDLVDRLEAEERKANLKENINAFITKFVGYHQETGKNAFKLLLDAVNPYIDEQIESEYIVDPDYDRFLDDYAYWHHMYFSLVGRHKNYSEVDAQQDMMRVMLALPYIHKMIDFLPSGTSTFLTTRDVEQIKTTVEREKAKRRDERMRLRGQKRREELLAICEALEIIAFVTEIMETEDGTEQLLNEVRKYNKVIEDAPQVEYSYAECHYAQAYTLGLKLNGLKRIEFVPVELPLSDPSAANMYIDSKMYRGCSTVPHIFISRNTIYTMLNPFVKCIPQGKTDGVLTVVIAVPDAATRNSWSVIDELSYGVTFSNTLYAVLLKLTQIHNLHITPKMLVISEKSYKFQTLHWIFERNCLDMGSICNRLRKLLKDAEKQANKEAELLADMTKRQETVQKKQQQLEETTLDEIAELYELEIFDNI